MAAHQAGMHIVARRYASDDRVPHVSLQQVAALLGAILMVAVILLDFSTSIELNVAMLYTAPLVLAAASRKRSVLWSMAGVLVVATFFVYHVQIPAAQSPLLRDSAGSLRAADAFLRDRALAAFAILLSAGLLHAWLVSLRSLVDREREVEEANEHLRRANHELRRQREEIARQYEELERRRSS